MGDYYIMPATKVGKIQALRYSRTSNGSLIKPVKQSNTDRCIDYIEDVNGDKIVAKDLLYIEQDEAAKIDGTQDKLINYAFNKHKCYDNETKKLLRSTLNCSSIESAKAEFKTDEDAYYRVKIESGHSRNVNKAFHIINSFKGHAVPADKVHAIGEEFARRLVGDSYRAVISTHTNTDHYHNHIVINAYAKDGPYKFRDDWNLGLKLQQISNELSLENGVEIITEQIKDSSFELDENKLTFTNIRDKKMHLKHSNRSKFISDILLTAKNSSNWEEYTDQLLKKGYDIKQNKKSVTYFHRDFRAIRDNRLGYQFTKAYILKYFQEKQALNEMSNIKININYKNLYVPKYIGSGSDRVRIPFIIRFASYLIKLFKEIISAEPQIYKKNTSFNRDYIKKLQKQTENLIKIENLLKKHQISNTESLKIKKNQLLKEYTKLYNKQKAQSTIVKKIKDIEKVFENYKYCKETIKKFQISENELNLYDFGNADILENKAKLDPITPKTKSRLYKALHNSGYILKYKYNQITETQAKEMCYFLSNENNIQKSKKIYNSDSAKSTFPGFCPPGGQKIPDELFTLQEYLNLKKNNKLPVYNYMPKENRFIKLDNDKIKQKYKINDNELLDIITYRDTVLKFRSYGLNSEENIDKFTTEYLNNIKSEYKNNTEELKNLKYMLSDISYIESFYNNTYENIYKPIKMLSEQEIVENDIQNYLRENQSTTEQLIVLRDTLKTIDLSILEDNDVIIAPIDILTAAKLCLYVQGQNIDTEDLLKLNKSDLKQIIENFTKNYDIDAILKTELDIESKYELSKEQSYDTLSDAKIDNDSHIKDVANNQTNDFERD